MILFISDSFFFPDSMYKTGSVQYNISAPCSKGQGRPEAREPSAAART